MSLAISTAPAILPEESFRGRRVEMYSGTASAYENKHFFVSTWGNKKIGYGRDAESENGADGVAYFSDVLYCGEYFNKAGVELQFTEAFTAEYGKYHRSAYLSSSSHICVLVFDTKSAAEKARRKRIAEYKSDDTIVRYFHNFRYYADDDSGYSGYSSYSSYSSYRYSSYSSYSSYRYSSYRYSSYTHLPPRPGPYIQRGYN